MNIPRQLIEGKYFYSWFSRGTLAVRDNICLHCYTSVHSNGLAHVTGHSDERGCSSEEHLPQKSCDCCHIFVGSTSVRVQRKMNRSTALEGRSVSILYPNPDRELTLSETWAYLRWRWSWTDLPQCNPSLTPFPSHSSSLPSAVVHSRTDTVHSRI